MNIRDSIIAGCKAVTLIDVIHEKESEETCDKDSTIPKVKGLLSDLFKNYFGEDLLSLLPEIVRARIETFSVMLVDQLDSEKFIIAVKSMIVGAMIAQPIEIIRKVAELKMEER